MGARDISGPEPSKEPNIEDTMNDCIKDNVMDELNNIFYFEEFDELYYFDKFGIDKLGNSGLHCATTDPPDSHSVAGTFDESSDDETTYNNGTNSISKENMPKILKTLPGSSQDRSKKSHQYKITDTLIEQGTFGKVLLGTDTINNKTVAIKVIHNKGFNCATNEIDILEYLNRHRYPFIISMDYHFYKKPYYYIVMPFIDGKDLYDLFNGKGPPYNTDRAYQLCVQIATAVAHLHQLNIVHHDIKPENVRIGKDRYPIILDLGLATQVYKDINGKDLPINKFCGTPIYMPPEYHYGLSYDGKMLDIWCLGIIFYYMFYWDHPYGDAKTPDSTLIKNINNKEPTYDDVKVSPSINNMIRQMLSKSANDRPTIGTIVERLNEINL